ncbi:MAG: hypothetical protein HXY18_19115 [Bryobacteraceae bacterium]|nr:hypothetical protein [Bryobacteraceae bacterium]
MPDHSIHGNHGHIHGQGCGHLAIKHNGHVDFIHDGCLHHLHGDHFDECRIEVSERNPSLCAPSGGCHAHGPACGHPALPHGDHVDYLVGGRLHHPHEGHCDDHGPVDVLG